MSNKQSAKMERSLTELPPNILMEILARLPLKTLFVSRSVCKTFLALSSPNPHFVDLHSSNAAEILLFQLGDTHNPSYFLRLAEPELDFRRGLALNFVLKPLFQLPKMGSSIPLYRTNFREENNFVLTNSCNGLIYLVRRYARDERSLVCNPVTNEYLMIPEIDGKIRLETETMSMWLGFSPRTNHYKVLRISRSLNRGEIAAQVLVIGSDSWRAIESVPFGGDDSWDLCPTFLKGIMYWLDESWRSIVFFNYENESFGDVALRPEIREEQLRNKQCVSIGVVGGCLCFSYNDFNAQHVDLWVMKKDGDGESWSKDLVIDVVRPVGMPATGRFKPLQILRNGQIVMLWVGNDLVFYDPRSKGLRFVGLRWLRLMPKDVVFTPSFEPLKDTLKVEKVLNRRLRPRGDEAEP